MNQTDLIAFYETRANTFTSSIKVLSTRINIIANFRLVTAIAFLIIIYFGFQQQILFFLLPVLAIAFFVLVKNHAKLFSERVHLEKLLLIQQNEIHGLQGNQSVFDAGSEFIDTHHAFSYDLDIFGEASIFQYINRSKNITGKTAFADSLRQPFIAKFFIDSKQEGIRELIGKTEFRHTFHALEHELNEASTDRDQIQEWLKSPSFLTGNKTVVFLLKVMPVVTIVSLIASFFISELFYLFLLCCITQWAMTAIYSKKVQAFHFYISNKKNILQKYALMLKCMSEGNFQSEILADYMECGKSTHKQVADLASLVGTFDARLNWMTFVVVNSTILFDLQCVYRLEKWKEKNSTLLLSLDLLHATEVLCSFANFAFNNPDYVFPTIDADGKFSATSLGHPLIGRSERVANDVFLNRGKSVMIITGANMAGKSTFLRTVGVNYVLALSGAPVCALSFTCPTWNLRSGMRTADSLHDHQSYFYAELNRLKSIVDELKSGEKLFILLDEILKGTNSNDKQSGSIALVKQLVTFDCITIIATHDLALGELEKEYPGKIRNFCFEPSIENDQLHFDYLLKPGVATKMNATFLMKKMGIIPA
jgi:hypothetical protein